VKRRQPYFRAPFLPPLRELDLLRFFPATSPPFFRPPLSDLFMRLEAEIEDLSKVKVARVERSGDISFVKAE
jgi:hypothetical protein